jgi:hypothetical protein
MRFMMIVRANQDTEAGKLPSEKDLADMARYNESLIKAGVMLAGEGLHPSSRGALVQFTGGKPKVIDGPFAEAKELIAGYWIIRVGSREEAVEWASKVPFQDGAVELRQIFELEDFPASDALERHRKLQDQLPK